MPKSEAKPVEIVIGPAAFIQAQVLIGEEGDKVAADCRLLLSALTERERAYVSKLIRREAEKG